MNNISNSGGLSTTSGGAVVDSGSLFGMVSRMGASRGRPFSKLLPAEQAQYIPVEFTGTGAEYFRIWIVNLLLTLVTLGIYYPWAKVRKLRYFHGNTSIAGHALDFHGEPRKMLRGSILAGVLFALYSKAIEFSPVAGLVGALLISALLPALLRSALQFRLANTSWRSLRFSFTGSARGAYKALALPMLLSLVPMALAAYAGNAEDEPALAGVELDQVAGFSYLALVALLPYFYWRLKKYQHDHYRLGQLQTELRLGAGAFYALGLRTLALAVVVPLLAVGLLALSLKASASSANGAMVIVLALFSLAWLVVPAAALWFYAVVGYFQVRMQNLLWSKTGNRYLRFRSKLKLKRFLALQLKNNLLVLLTLGLYWPWAVIATRRMRLEAVMVVTRIDIDELVIAAKPRAGDAAADMGDDLLGFDIGL